MYVFNRYVWLFNLFCFAKSNRPYYNSNLVIATEGNSTWISIVTITWLAQVSCTLFPRLRGEGKKGKKTVFFLFYSQETSLQVYSQVLKISLKWVPPTKSYSNKISVLKNLIKKLRPGS